ncbi:hypothetical protein CASFOL_003205 [Castilleja foliolosa]|uniref:MORF/ORRM1/DAG-like MORF domain-containing protein n=1 Tax=Castilleja foliolosa TaxID=1961234 RepID=A0ABD3EKE1_9LAMI
MAVARAQVRGFCKRWFSGGVSIPRTRVSSSEITDDDNDKFRFLDAVEGTPWPDSPFNRWDVFIKRSCLKGATQEEKMNFYVKTAAQILRSSEEEAKERIYKITADCSFDGFGLQISFGRMHNFEGLRSIIDKENLEIPVARAQIRGFCKRWFSGVSIPRTPPASVSSSQITDDDKDKFWFLDAGEGTLWPYSPINRCQVFIKRSCLKGATQEEKMDFYVKTAAQILRSSEEEAKERIYKITADCSYDGFGLQISFDLESVIDKKVGDTPGTVCFNDGELIRWSLISKRREKGRFPLPIPDADTESDLEN